MTQLDYFFTHPNGTTESYQLIRFALQEPWRIILEGEYLGSVEKVGEEWRQLSGGDLDTAFFNGITTFIESQHFNSLPNEILSRWPKLVQEVVMRSDQEYLVICREGIHFEHFYRIFTRFVPLMLKDEWPVTFQVYNHDFSEDFNAIMNPEKKHRPPAYQAWNA
ncbi:MAG: hypothetical protein EOP53_24225 [Sphingobacteriales bacterium]|nr:MAG: hypothetical protein EOP53_24225 [Sphingobacteriales bacterium]